MRRYSKLRREAREGDVNATSRMRGHVRRRVSRGWKLKTIAERLGITVDEVIVFAGDALIDRNFDSTPRLVRR